MHNSIAGKPELLMDPGSCGQSPCVLEGICVADADFLAEDVQWVIITVPAVWSSIENAFLPSLSIQNYPAISCSSALNGY